VHDTRRTRLILGVLLVAALALMTFDARGGSSPIARLRGAGTAVFGTAESVAGTVAAPFVRVFDAVTGGPGQQNRIAALQQQVTSLQTQLSQARLAKAEEAQLQQLLQLAGRGRYRVVAATVIAAAPDYEGTVTIDVGASDGVRPEETVVNGSGLVGVVTAVSARTATVQLVTDAATTVGVRMAGTGQIGAASGTGRTRAVAGLLRLQVFDSGAVLRPGERLVTFGSVGGRPYVPGVPVGVITQVTGSANSLTKLALVRPFADPSALGVVGVVIVPPRTDPRDSVLPPVPPRPAPSPAASPHRPARAGATPGASATATPTG
jgi:rod shape-determining protein MreC